jgi:RNA polymerase-binding transcription factor DksA
MTESVREEYRERLQGLIDRLRGDVSALREEALQPTGGAPGGGRSEILVQDADRGVQAEEEDLALAVLGGEARVLEEAAAALARIEAGAFGRCEACGKPIPRKRLDAVPYARHCIACARSREKAAP